MSAAVTVIGLAPGFPTWPRNWIHSVVPASPAACSIATEACVRYSESVVSVMVAGMSTGKTIVCGRGLFRSACASATYRVPCADRPAGCVTVRVSRSHDSDGFEASVQRAGSVTMFLSSVPITPPTSCSWGRNETLTAVFPGMNVAKSISAMGWVLSGMYMSASQRGANGGSVQAATRAAVTAAVAASARWMGMGRLRFKRWGRAAGTGHG